MSFTNTCTEIFLDDIVRVYPLEAGVLVNSMPETMQTDSVNVTQLKRDVNGTPTAFGSMDSFRQWLAGYEHFVEGDESLLGLQLEEPVTLKIATERNVSGYQYMITFSLATMYYHEEERAFIRQLENRGHDFIIERQDGSFGLLRYFAPAQKVTHETGGGSANVSVSMKNVTGLQDIVTATA